tara:strand:- start:6 stop:242 length:237 start_codon:yes stop_codon:yes gene_type:complete
MISVLLAFGFGEDILQIVCILIISLLILILSRKKRCFQFLAKLNKLILPSLYNKDIKKLKKWEMTIVAYRYWVTKNAI